MTQLVPVLPQQRQGLAGCGTRSPGCPVAPGPRSSPCPLAAGDPGAGGGTDVFPPQVGKSSQPCLLSRSAVFGCLPPRALLPPVLRRCRLRVARSEPRPSGSPAWGLAAPSAAGSLGKKPQRCSVLAELLGPTLAAWGAEVQVGAAARAPSAAGLPGLGKDGADAPNPIQEPC